MNIIAEQRDDTISSLNENHEAFVEYRARNAFLLKLEYSPLYVHGSEVAIEVLTLTREGLVVDYL